MDLSIPVVAMEVKPALLGCAARRTDTVVLLQTTAVLAASQLLDSVLEAPSTSVLI